MNTIKYGNIKRAQVFNYLCEILSPYLNEKVAFGENKRKLKTAIRLWQKTYKAKSLSREAKFRHCSVVVIAKFLCSAEIILVIYLKIVKKGRKKISK